MSTYLTLNFETYGAPLHSLVASHGWCSLYGWDRVPPTNIPFASDYPGIYEAMYLDVLAGAGKDGSFGLGYVEFPADGTDWFDAYLILAVMGGASVADYVLTPLADAGKGRVQMDVIFGATPMSVVGGYQWDLFDVSGGFWDSSDSIYLFLSNAGQTQGAYEWQLRWDENVGAHDGTEPRIETVAAGDYADLVDGQAHTVEVTWQCGTLTQWASSGDMTVASDGWIKLKVDGVTLIHVTGTPLVVNCWGSAAAYGDGAETDRIIANVNRFASVNFGPQNGGLCGVYDNIIVGTPEAWIDAANFVEQEIPSSAFPGGAARVVCKCWNADGSAMQARLYDQTNGVSVGESAVVESATPADASFTVTLTSGTARYRLQVTGSVGADLFCVAPGLMP